MNKSEGELNKKEKDPTKEKEITRKTRIKVVRLSAQTVSSCGIIEDFGFLEIVAQTHPFKDMWRVSWSSRDLFYWWWSWSARIDTSFYSRLLTSTRRSLSVDGGAVVSVNNWARRVVRQLRCWLKHMHWSHLYQIWSRSGSRAGVELITSRLTSLTQMSTWYNTFRIIDFRLVLGSITR